MSKWLVSTQWLSERLAVSNVVVMDASWHLPTERRDAGAEYLEGHIPGALFFDVDELSDSDTSLPHMLPTPEKFASGMRRMGVGDGDRVVVYDAQGLFSAARAWWMFRVFGHDDVAVLDGGLKKWKAEGRPLERGAPPPRGDRTFGAQLRTAMVCDREDMVGISSAGDRQIVDARSAPRFAGVEPEPRPGLRSGHIPGSRNVHYAGLLNEDGTLKPPEVIEAIFRDAGVDLEKPIATSCGSGVTAAVLTLALNLAGHEDTKLYDGSWTEWGSDETLPLETGEAR